MFKPGTILNDTWEVKRRIGQGSFCELFLAHNIVDKNAPLVAVKAQNDGIEASIIRVEGDVIKSLNDIPSVPRFYFYGQHRGIDYIVMELLGGEDMSKLRNRARAASHANLVALPVASFLSREILKSVKAIHAKGYIHRDIKPANFVRRNKGSSEFCMVDFGLARQYRDRDGNIRPKRDVCEFRGTALYASPFIHEGEEQCPRDDLFSLIFVFCDLVCGKLPWSEAAKSKDKGKVAALKRQYLSDPRRFVDWIKHQADDADKNKRLTDGEANFPPTAQEQCLIIIRHLQSLKYEDTPDYDLIDSAYVKSVSSLHDDHDVSEIDYSYGGFDWQGGLDTAKSWGMGLNGALNNDERPDYNQMQKILLARCRVLGKDIKKSRQLTASLSAKAMPFSPTPFTSLSLDIPLPSSTATSIASPPLNTSVEVEALVAVEVAASTSPSHDVAISNHPIVSSTLSTSQTSDTHDGGDCSVEHMHVDGCVNEGENENRDRDGGVVGETGNAESALEDILAMSDATLNNQSHHIKDNMRHENRQNGFNDTSLDDNAPSLLDGMDGQTRGEVVREAQSGGEDSGEPLGLDYDELANMLAASNSPPPAAHIATVTNNNTSNDNNSNSNSSGSGCVRTDSDVVRTSAAHADECTASASIKEEDNVTLTALNESDSYTGSKDIAASEVRAEEEMVGEVMEDKEKKIGEEEEEEKEEKDIKIDVSLVPPVGLQTPSMSEMKSPVEFRGSRSGSVTNMPIARCTDFALALLWSDIATQALSIPESLILRDTIEALDALLRDAGRFFSCHIGSVDEDKVGDKERESEGFDVAEDKWDAFLQIQNVAYLIGELMTRRSKAAPRRDSTSTPHTHPRVSDIGGSGHESKRQKIHL